MTPEYKFQVPFYFLFLATCIIVWLLKIAFQSVNKSTDVEAPKIKSSIALRSLVRISSVLIKWYLNTNAIKRPFIEEFRLALKKYTSIGEMKSVKFFKIIGVFNDDADSIKSVLLNGKITSLGADNLVNILSSGNRRGIFHSDGQTRRELKKYSVKKLGEFASGSNGKLPNALSEILPDLLARMESKRLKSGNQIQVTNLFLLHTINAILAIIGFPKMSEGDEKVKTLQNSFHMITNTSLGKLYSTSFLPNFETVHNLMGLKPLIESFQKITQFCQTQLDEKMQLNAAGETQEDFVEQFRIDIEKYKNDDNLKEIFCKEQLESILGDFVFAGMDTTSTFMEIAVMYMILNPKVQCKVQDEIDLVIGQKNQPSYADHRESTPYICATLMEIHRMGSIVPATSRYIPDDIECKGLILEKGTQIFNMMWAIRMDEDYWGDPHVFRPERFLNEDGTTIKEKMSHVIPFSSGSRMCPGNKVAAAITYTLFVGLLQKYTLTKAYDQQVLRLKNKLSITTHPIPFHVSIKNRL